ncbi:MAG: alkane 1-monooxygenase [Myxococcales bacterium]|nr:alkane 1-monooxygenase [Myxococcales bacterium]MCB9576270.1 alkane 1-monooxygenase [Polyangiaceae bacterium]
MSISIDLKSDEGSASVPRIWARHLLCLSMPLSTLSFVATGPHPASLSVLWLLVVVASVLIDNRAGPARQQPAEQVSAWPFDAILYLLVALQVVNLLLMARMFALGGLLRVDTLVAAVLLSVNSGYSAIVVAHELIHRRERHLQVLGRLLLVTVCYEHFFTEHVRGHHVRVGTLDDPATARFGETFHQFWRRTVPAQFRSALALEKKRLGDADMRLWDRRMLKNRVVHGLVAELTLAAALLAVFGPAAMVVFLLQALGAIRLLEAVNYFEHWGLSRAGRKVTPLDSWDAESWFTLYSLVGLSRHADHHAHATRPYEKLRHFEESPKLPRGYFGMVVMVLFRNRRFIELMTRRMEVRRLGPFAIG